MSSNSLSSLFHFLCVPRVDRLPKNHMATGSIPFVAKSSFSLRNCNYGATCFLPFLNPTTCLPHLKPINLIWSPSPFSPSLSYFLGFCICHPFSLKKTNEFVKTHIREVCGYEPGVVEMMKRNSSTLFIVLMEEEQQEQGWKVEWREDVKEETAGKLDWESE